MRRLFIISIFCLGVNISCSTPNLLKQKYPNGLLTNDYGILNEDDLGVYAWWAKPRPYDENNTAHGYMYWQCFPVSTVKLGCQQIDSDDPKNPYSDADIRIETEKEIHEYSFRRAIELTACNAYLKNWQKLVARENAVCFGGKLVDSKMKVVKGKPKKVTAWIYDKLKTKKGCYSYFERHCDIAYWKSEGYPLQRPNDHLKK